MIGGQVAKLMPAKPRADSPVSHRVRYAKCLLAAGQFEEAYEILYSLRDIITNESDLRAYEESYWLRGMPVELLNMKACGAAFYVVSELNGITNVLDVGSGGGEQADYFAQNGMMVTCIDFGTSVYFESAVAAKPKKNVELVVGDFMSLNGSRKYDLVWASHFLEHQPNSVEAIQKIFELTSDDGYVAITVPPLKHDIVGGHLSLWNAGLLLYNIVFAGYDCSGVTVMNYGYNVSIVVQKKKIDLPSLDYDSGDVNRLRRYLPLGCDEGFDGRMLCRDMH